MTLINIRAESQLGLNQITKWNENDMIKFQYHFSFKLCKQTFALFNYVRIVVNENEMNESKSTFFSTYNIYTTRKKQQQRLDHDYHKHSTHFPSNHGQPLTIQTVWENDQNSPFMVKKWNFIIVNRLCTRRVQCTSSISSIELEEILRGSHIWVCTSRLFLKSNLFVLHRRKLVTII